MNRLALVCFACLLALAVSIPSPSLAAPAPESLRPQVERAVRDACPSCRLLSVERRVLSGNVAEYSFPVRVGGGEHDVIRLHRVVKESAPFVPIHAPRGLFMAPGDIWNFDAAFLSSVASPAVADDHALPIFLAKAGIDVWGIDFRWTLVPATTTDFSFMAGWGIDTDTADLGVGLAVARTTRGLTGSGIGRLTLLGWSRGGQIGYSYVGAESQIPEALRQVKGFIPVDILVKTNDSGVKAAACLRLDLTLDRLAAGEIADGTGGLAATIGNLAKSAPGATSPIIPTFTNLQVGLLTGEATFALQPPGGANVPDYHFTGGTFDGSGAPTGLSYSSQPGLFDFLTLGSPFEPIQELADGDAALCEHSDTFEVPDVAFDDHLGDIKVPILYVGAGGGFGDFGLYTLGLLGSSDVTTHVVSLTPPAARILDIGHADIFQANDAQTLFWQPILGWLRSH
ncbi:MAG TPA: hypothetical protein VN851_13750 [Thermoanaerobaculia bacterium]|nr:hypothetical protein [Thermoanaerobaculia bacterium]